MWPVLADFFMDDSGKITQKRLLKEKDKARRRIEAAKISGSIGGTVNALKNHTPVVANATNPLKRNGSERGSKIVADEQLSIIHNPDKKEEVPPLIPQGGKQSRGTRLPDSFPDEWCMAAARDYWAKHGRIDIDPAEQVVQFRAHHEARGTTSKKWSASWQTWYMNAIKFNKPAVAKPAVGRNSLMEAALELARRN
tara:strand:+ start:6700 stop:7287 length:588 start_codon:yes stop_codon:yes gene_type:complete